VTAFCVARLGADVIDAPMRGIDARRRGILMHRVLELVLDPDAAGDPRDRVAPSVATAFAELVPPGNRAWTVQVEAERQRVKQLTDRLLEIEADRAPFRTIAVERRVDIEIAGRRLRCRIDRLDRLETGREILIDYKTGKRPITGWFSDRLGDCQLPLYAQRPDGRTCAIVVIALNENGVEFRGAGDCPDALPGRQRGFESAEWALQIDRWRVQIETLIGECAAGDVRVRKGAPDPHDRAFVPLTRAFEESQ
jgi:hypothetical protein